MALILLLRLAATAGQEISLLVSLLFLLLHSSKVSSCPVICSRTKLTNADIGGKNHLADASTILFCISFILVIAVYVIYWKGPVLRKRSPFAQQLSDARAELNTGGHRLSRMPTGSRANSFARSQQNLRIRQNLGSRQNSFVGTKPPHSRQNSSGVATPAEKARSAANSRRNSVVNVPV